MRRLFRRWRERVDFTAPGLLVWIVLGVGYSLWEEFEQWRAAGGMKRKETGQ